MIFVVLVRNGKAAFPFFARAACLAISNVTSEGREYLLLVVVVVALVVLPAFPFVTSPTGGNPVGRKS